MSQFSRLEGQKINIQNQWHFYTLAKNNSNERIKFLGTNMVKVHGLYSKNQRASLKQGVGAGRCGGGEALDRERQSWR